MTQGNQLLESKRTANVLGSGVTLTNDTIRVKGIHHKISADDFGTNQHSEMVRQKSPKRQHKMMSGELEVDKSESNEVAMESLLNFHELLNSKDILGSSLPIS